MFLRENAIFINYRIKDSLNFARELERQLNEHYGGELVVFRDQTTIQYLQDWKREIQTALEQAEIMLAIIGPGWTSHFVHRNPEEDFVRMEIAYALKEGIDVIPVLLHSADLPHSISEAPVYFPQELYPLIDRQGCYVGKDWSHGISEMINSIDVLRGEKSVKEVIGGHYKKIDPLVSLPLPAAYRKKLRKRQEDRKPYVTQPFIGPQFMDQRYAEIFFGREYEIRTLFHLIRRSRLALLDGYSGCGKSSVLHAGLLARMGSLENWQLIPPVRRSRIKGGLYVQAQVALKEVAFQGDKKVLLILDQVEEMYTDPLTTNDNEETEIEAFGKWLQETLNTYPQLHILLAFRSEYLRKIEFLLRDFVYEYEFNSMTLKSISEEGIKRIIQQPAKSSLFHYSVDVACADQIARDFTGHEFVPYGILLQIQLVELWKGACKVAEEKGERKIHLTKELYQQYKQGDVTSFVERKLEEIAETYPWGDKIQGGFGWEVLYRFTTDDGTATSMEDGAFATLYEHLKYMNEEGKMANVDPYVVLAAFKKGYLLSEAGIKMRMNDEEEPGPNRITDSTSRLAHDSLARVVRKQYSASDLAAQRAWRIIESKQQKDGTIGAFSESDISIVEAGKYYVQKIPENVWKRLEEDRKIYRKRREARFQSALNNARRCIENLAYEEALTYLYNARDEKIYDEQLRELAWHLPYVLMELEQWENLTESLHFLRSVGETASWVKALAEKNSFERASLIPLFKKHRPTWYDEMHAYYYPEMVKIQGGPFTMGSEDFKNILPRESPAHKVTISDFSIGATPVTHWQYGLYTLLTEQKLPSDSGFGRGDRPAINVSWYEAVKYCNWLSERMGKEAVYTGEKDETKASWNKNGFRLPTEAEWEYAASMGGNGKKFANGKDVADPEEINFNPDHEYNSDYMAKFHKKGVNRQSTTPVKYFAPNEWGLYDMSGNVYDWVWDWYDLNYYQQCEGEIDPKGPASGPEGKRVLKGGSWRESSLFCRLVSRNDYRPLNGDSSDGFRVAGC